MDVAKRMHLIRIIKKIERNPVFGAKLGIQNKSVLKPQKKRW